MWRPRRRWLACVNSWPTSMAVRSGERGAVKCVADLLELLLGLLVAERAAEPGLVSVPGGCSQLPGCRVVSGQVGSEHGRVGSHTGEMG